MIAELPDGKINLVCINLPVKFRKLIVIKEEIDVKAYNLKIIR